MRSSIKAGSILAYLGVILAIVISLVYTPIFISKLGPSQYGIFALISSIMAYISLLDVGLGSAVVRYNSKYRAENVIDRQQRINGMFFLIYCVISILSIIVGIYIYSKFDHFFAHGLTTEEIILLKKMFLIAVINLAISFPASVFSSIITAYERFIFLKGINLIRSVFNPLIMLIVLELGYKAYGILVATTIVNFIIVAINIWYCTSRLKVKFVFVGFEKSMFVEVLKYSFFIFLAAAGYQLFWNSDQLILAAFANSTVISIYAISTQINMYFTTFSNSASSMFLPKLTKLTVAKANNEEVMNELIKVSRIQFIISSFVFTGFALVGSQFIDIWLGNRFHLSYVLAIILISPQILSITQSVFASMLESMNKHQIKACIYMFVALINIVISILLVPKWGAIGCAIGTTVGMVINTLLNNLYYYYVLHLDLKRFWSQISILTLPLFACSFIGWGLLSYFSITSYYSLIIFITIYSIIFIGIFMIFGFNKYERSIVFSLIHFILKRINSRKGRLN